SSCRVDILGSHQSDNGGGEVVAGFPLQFGKPAVEGHATTPQYDHAIGTLDLIHEVSRPQDADVLGQLETNHFVEDVTAAGRIEADRRLVHQQHSGPVQ